MAKRTWIVASCLVVVAVASVVFFVLANGRPSPAVGVGAADAADADAAVPDRRLVPLSDESAVSPAVASAVGSDRRLDVGRADAERLANTVTSFLAAWNQESGASYTSLLESHGLRPAVDYTTEKGRDLWWIQNICLRDAMFNPDGVKVKLAPYTGFETIKQLSGEPPVGYSYKSSMPDKPRGSDDPVFGDSGVLAEVVLPGRFATIDETTGAGEFALYFIRPNGKSEWVLVGSTSRSKMSSWIAPPPAK